LTDYCEWLEFASGDHRP